MSPDAAPARSPWPTKAALASAIAFAAAFVVWSVFALNETRVSRFDAELASSLKVVAEHRPYWRSAFVGFTLCGGIRAGIVLAALGVVWSWRRGDKRFAAAWALIVAAGGLTDLVLKQAFDRPRPPVHLRDAFVSQTNESYPSGHAMGSVIGYGLWCYALQNRIRQALLRLLAASGLGLWIGGICFSRVFLRAHWMSDVIGGTLVGIAFLLAALTLWERSIRTRSTGTA